MFKREKGPTVEGYCVVLLNYRTTRTKIAYNLAMQWNKAGWWLIGMMLMLINRPSQKRVKMG